MKGLVGFGKGLAVFLFVISHGWLGQANAFDEDIHAGDRLGGHFVDLLADGFLHLSGYGVEVGPVGENKADGNFVAAHFVLIYLNACTSLLLREDTGHIVQETTATDGHDTWDIEGGKFDDGSDDVVIDFDITAGGGSEVVERIVVGGHGVRNYKFNVQEETEEACVKGLRLLKEVAWPSSRYTDSYRDYLGMCKQVAVM